MDLVAPEADDYAGGGADVPRAVRELIDSHDDAFTATSGQILIAQPSDVARFKAMSGDVSINKDGVTAIGANKLATGMYQDGSVTEAKLDDGAVTEGKLADGAVTSAKIKDGGVTLSKTGTGANGLAAGAFSVYRNAAHSGSGVVPFDTEEFDVSGWHDVGTHKGRYTPQIPGYYSFDVSLSGSENVIGEKSVDLYLLKNGERLKFLDIWTSSSSYSSLRVSGSAIAVANGSTDYFEIEAILDGVTNFGVGAQNCWFQGHLIGKS
jgi:hypothetical protein